MRTNKEIKKECIKELNEELFRIKRLISYRRKLMEKKIKN